MVRAKMHSITFLIGMRHIKERRARKIVPIVPGETLADFVPFYFAPRSPMLYAMSKKDKKIKNIGSAKKPRWILV